MRSDIIDHRLSVAGRPSLAQLLSPAVIGEYVLRLWRTHQERRHLAELDPRLLRDIGIDPVAAAQEVDRPFWELSGHHEAAFRRQLFH
jgi:uncharacterized protein YjiS (DUF1127 family)